MDELIDKNDREIAKTRDDATFATRTRPPQVTVSVERNANTTLPATAKWD